MVFAFNVKSAPTARRGVPEKMDDQKTSIDETVSDVAVRLFTGPPV